VAVGAAAANIEGNAKQSIEMSSGQYKKYPGRKEHPHWSSPPGTPPNNDLGELANSIESKMTGRTSAQVNVHAKYGIPLELGWMTQSGTHVPARPFLRPAVEKEAPAFQAAVKVILKGGK
jgi:phage gpG-like protein